MMLRPYDGSVHLLGYWGQTIGRYCLLSFQISKGLVITVDMREDIIEAARIERGCLAGATSISENLVI